VEPEFHDFLKAVFKKHMIQKGRALLHGGLGINLSLDKQLEITDAEFDRMEAQLELESDKLAEEMIDELDAKGFKSPDDLIARADEVKRVTDAYAKRMVKSVK
jgi:biotin-(acetyl-CoA carboxylase) ligase